MMTEPFRDPEWTSWLPKEELWGGAGGADGLVGTYTGAQPAGPLNPRGPPPFSPLPTTGGGPSTNSPNVPHTKSDLAPLRRGTGSHVELWSDTGAAKSEEKTGKEQGSVGTGTAAG